jgi:hypothetical protein
MVRSTFMTKGHIISDKLKEKNQTQILRLPGPVLGTE